MEKIRLLFTIGKIDTGGKERQLFELIKNLSKDKYEVYLIYSSGNAAYLDEAKMSIKESYAIGLLDAVKFFWCVKKVDPRFVLCWSSPTSYLAYVQKAFLSGNFILINMNLQDAPVRKTPKQRLEGCLYNYFKTVVANSYAGLESYNQLGRNNRFVMHNGFDLGRVRDTSKTEAREKLLLERNKFIVPMVAGLKNNKDHITFIKAAKACSLVDKDIAFYIVGEGPNKVKLQDFVKKLRIINVIFLGNRTDVEYILCASDVSVLSSTNGEGISNAILESLACGVPVIATEGGGTREILTNGQNGYLVKPCDFKDIARKIVYLKNHRVFLNKLSQNAKESIFKFSMENMVNKFEEILEVSSHGV